MVSSLSMYSSSLMGKDCCPRCVHITFSATSILPGMWRLTMDRSARHR